MESAPTAATPEDVPAIEDVIPGDGEVIGAAVVTLLDGTRKILAGTRSDIYNLQTGVWVSVGDSYTGGDDTRWSITQFGNTTVFANGTDPIQVINWDDIEPAFAAESLTAKIVFSLNAFVIALNIDDGTEQTDGWACCAAYDVTDWTPAPATQSNSGRLVSIPGALTAGGPMGEYAIAYKETGIFLGQYVGSPEVWRWREIESNGAGCVGQDAWCDIGGAHFFVGRDNFYLLTASSAIPIGDGLVKRWFQRNADQMNLFKTICVYDNDNDRVSVFFQSTANSFRDEVMVYQPKTKKWGRMTLSIESALVYISAGFTIDGLQTLSTTISGLPSIPFDSAYWSAGARSMSFFNTDHQLQNLSGEPGTSSLTTWEVGDDSKVTTVTRVKARFVRAPTSARCQMRYSMTIGSNFEAGSTSTMNDGKFDVRQTARWHKARLTMEGDHRISHVGADFRSSGKR
jgi:hypothetical protein